MDESRDKSPTAILLFAKNTSKEEKKKKRERENKRKNRRQNETLERLLGRIKLGYANKFLRNVNYRS